MANLQIRACILGVSATLTVADARAEGCPTPADEIATNRPDVTNSSLVVPVGSFQSENGINLSARDGGRTFDGTDTRWRLGIAPCFEALIDLPTYFANIESPGVPGFSDVGPALKWQISPVPGKIDLSMTMGVFLPTGSVEIAGRGAQPYLQFPWSWVAQLVRLPVDLIVASGDDTAARYAKAATKDIPIVATCGNDLVETGLVASIKQPGGNLTCISVFSVQLLPKSLQLAREIIGSSGVIAFLLNPKNPERED